MFYCKLIIYKITNLVNGKIYIGQTSQLLKERFYQHAVACTLLGDDMRKFGIENFKSEILEVCTSRDKLNEREKFWILKENSLYPNGYNKSLSDYNYPNTNKNENFSPLVNSKIIFNIKNGSAAIKSICGKYKIDAFFIIDEFKVVRFKELQRYIGKISVKTLTNVLRELEHDGLIERKEFPEKVRRVEYSLSERGKNLIPILNSLCDWGENL